MQQIRVRVPCSTSNLGAGFDCIGLALNRYLTATLLMTDTRLEIERTGTLAGMDEGAADDLVCSAMRAFDYEPRGNLLLESDIPVGRGLGSSAAAAVAGLMIAARVRGHDVDHAEVAAHATSLEGHPDNAVPSAFGGLIAAITAADRQPAEVHVHRLKLSRQLRFVFAAPQAIVSTKAARQALPAQITHRAATNAVARCVALIEGLAAGDAELLRIGFTDELHMPYRLPMIPGGSDVLRAAVEAGAHAATISGSGSGLIAVCAQRDELAVAEAMRIAFERATAQAAIAFGVEPDELGAQYLDT